MRSATPLAIKNKKNPTPIQVILFITAALILSIIAWSLVAYSGDRLILLLFHIAFCIVLLLIFVRPKLDGYLFLAIFLFLGFWLKFIVHLVLHYDFVEPVGRFDGSPAIWDRALGAATMGAAGVAAARAVHLLICRRIDETGVTVPLAWVPFWYPRYRLLVWALCGSGAIALFTANYFFAFFQTGINMRLVLPFGLSVLFAWASFIGIQLLFALLLDWEGQTKPKNLILLIATIGLLGTAEAVSILSRATTLFLIVAYMTAILLHMSVLRKRLWTTYRWRLPFILIISLILSLSAVSWIRLLLYVPTDTASTGSDPSVVAYYGAQKHPKVNSAVVPTDSAGNTSPTVSPDITAAKKVQRVAKPPTWITPGWVPPALEWPFVVTRQLVLLSVDRWIGLEGVLSVASSPEQLGWDLFKRGLTEKASTGINSIYQIISASYYVYDKNLTFLTLPGAIAVLFYSGSGIVVFFGMFFICGILILSEFLVLRLLGSRFMAAVMAIFMANAICQMNFPYLWFVFVAENLTALLGFYCLRAPWIVFRRTISRR